MAVRDLFVSIDFHDIDISALTQIDSAMDEIEDSFRQMDRDIDDAARNFTRLGAQGDSAMNEISGSAENAADALDEVRREANRADAAIDNIDGENIDIDFDINFAQLLALQGILHELERDSRRIDRDFDTMTDSTNRFGNNAGRIFKRVAMSALNLSGTITLVTAALSLLPAVGAPVLTLLGGLSASLLAAGTGAVAYGAVATSALGGVFEAAQEVEQIQQKIDDASTTKERIAAEKELAEVYDGLSKAQEGALESLQEFKSFWGEFVQGFEKPIFTAFTEGLELVKGIFEGLEPTISAVAGVVTDLITRMNEGVQAGGLKDFFAWMEETAPRAVETFATIVGNTLQGVWNIIAAFGDVSGDIEQGLVSMTEKFVAWSETLGESQGFKDFINYAVENGPILLSIIGNLASIFGNLMQTLAPFGGDTLVGIEKFTSLIVEGWPYVQIVVTSLLGPLYALLGVFNNLGMIWDALKGKAQELASSMMSSFQQALSSAQSTWNGIRTAVAQGIQGAATAVTGSVGRILSSITSTFNSVKSATASAWNSVKQSISSAMSAASGAVSGFFSPLMGWINSAKSAWNSFTSALKSFKMPKISFPKIPAGISKFIPGFATGIERVPVDNMPAFLHKDEAVLTATQSNALREAGMLTSNGGKPKLNLGESTNNTKGSVVKAQTASAPTFAPQVSITINGTGGNDQSIADLVAEETNRQLEKFWRKMVLTT